MNLKVPTLPLSIPIHVPIGGLLMISMTSPLCKTGPVELKFLRRYQLITTQCVIYWIIPSVWGSPCHRDWGWSQYELERVHRRVRGKAAHPLPRPQTSHSLCCCWMSQWCPPSGHLHKPQKDKWATSRPQDSTGLLLFEKYFLSDWGDSTQFSTQTNTLRLGSLDYLKGVLSLKHFSDKHHTSGVPRLS